MLLFLSGNSNWKNSMRQRVLTEATELHGISGSNFLEVDTQRMNEGRLSSESLALTSFPGWSSTHAQRQFTNDTRFSKHVDSYISSPRGDIGVRLSSDPMIDTEESYHKPFNSFRHFLKKQPTNFNTQHTTSLSKKQSNNLTSNKDGHKFIIANPRTFDEDNSLAKSYNRGCMSKSEPSVMVMVEPTHPDVDELVPLQEFQSDVAKKSRWSTSSKKKNIDNSRYD